MDLTTPSLVIEADQMERNLRDMQQFADKTGVKLRPHSKAHKVPKLATKQIEYGADGICVQKISEALVMVENGVTNVFVSNVVVSPEKLDIFADLSSKAQMSICVDSEIGINRLAEAAIRKGEELNCLVEVDCGLHRCGVDPERAGDLSKLVSGKKNLVFRGMTAYEGHIPNYPKDQWPNLVEQAMAIVSSAKRAIESRGLKCDDVIVGGTSTAKISGKYPDVTEITPGGYLFYDEELVDSGLVGLEKCSLSVLCTVVSRQQDDRVILDGGIKTFDIDQGKFPRPKDPSLNLEFLYLNEEHAVLKLKDSETKRKMQIGTKWEFIPYLVSTCVNLHDFLFLQKEGKIVEVLKVLARGKVW